MAKIIIKFAPGKPRELKVEGATGATCKDLSLPYEKIIGGEVISDVPTAEMNQGTVGQGVQVNG